ncbi:hypothetical protein PGH12_06715 [Chryseobacterium wangxinyae]|uniref:hypothetical protein n=1 Tax=Chryseobacterium sp. CY350 TaxID=2997336 RepID=UPI002270FD52|nr:hypothetical protein [Chryseobacterium sp. CY350]MCY0976842.1 hypothetical protein [Chryseobacterium sp. CY350]WBZ96843.1 hypothetical protein PGH12_06715 [Chryseobacterium sp. CY350]
MKKFRQTIDQQVLNAEQKWKALPEARQRILTEIFFAVYTLLTIAAFVQIWWSAAHNEPIPIGGHISNIPAGVNINQKATK